MPASFGHFGALYGHCRPPSLLKLQRSAFNSPGRSRKPERSERAGQALGTVPPHPQAPTGRLDVRQQGPAENGNRPGLSGLSSARSANRLIRHTRCHFEPERIP